ncbi:pleckstrin homology domain-containing family A member 8 isoform X2 [Nilaparvata lugens]|nr:pleckstrin homology domain-containing family A member 8 isoform X2 [Nilaparvata lugens]
MTGNIDKLSEKYASNEEKFEFLNDMVLHDKEAQEITAIDALLWLNRANHLVQRFFELILEDNASEEPSDDLVKFLKAAYKDTLKEHHGWIAQHLFTFLSRMCPTRKDLVNVLALERENMEDIVYRDMESFTNKLRENVTFILTFYKENDLENYPKPS